MPNETAAWTDANLVAIDLEGSGPQDPDGEAILEIALVPIHDGHPDLTRAFTTLINPQRRITRHPWTSTRHHQHRPPTGAHAGGGGASHHRRDLRLAAPWKVAHSTPP